MGGLQVLRVYADLLRQFLQGIAHKRKAFTYSPLKLGIQGCELCAASV